MPGALRLSGERFGGLWSHRVGTLGGYNLLARSFPMPETSPRATVSPGGFWEEHLGWGDETECLYPLPH